MAEQFLRDLEQKEQEDERWLESRPICDECGEHIQGNYKYVIDGKTYCEDCINDFAESID